MLKGIPPVLSPELLKILMEMGHGDTLILGDGNFPAASNAQRLVRCDGLGVPALLDAVLTVFPLDSYALTQAGLMKTLPEEPQPPIWDKYKRILQKHEPKYHTIEMIERFEFYERARKAYAVAATSETAIYANILLKKGVV